MILEHKIFSILLFVAFLIFMLPSGVSACTYEATITGNHLDFAITSDLDKLAVVQYIRQSGTALVTKMYSPTVGYDWTYFDDFACDIGLSTPVACRQNRSGKLGDGAFWQWYDWAGKYYHVVPGYRWGIDFDSPPTYDSLGIEYGTTGGGEAWKLCDRT
ncbi:MAG: hypothetical protein WC389_21510, partial [Lutibacter sp.]